MISIPNFKTTKIELIQTNKLLNSKLLCSLVNIKQLKLFLKCWEKTMTIFQNMQNKLFLNFMIETLNLTYMHLIMESH